MMNDCATAVRVIVSAIVLTVVMFGLAPNVRNDRASITTSPDAPAGPVVHLAFSARWP